MTTAETRATVGAGVDRVDGRAQGHRRRAVPLRRHAPGMAHAALVRSHHRGRPHPQDRHRGRARPRPASCTVITPRERAAARPRRRMTLLGPPPPAPAAGRPDPAPRPARRRRGGRHAPSRPPRRPVSWSSTTSAAEPLLDDRRPARRTVRDPWGRTASAATSTAALAAADVVRRGDLHDAGQHQQPARAVRHGRRLGRRHGSTVHDATQWPAIVARDSGARVFGLPESGVRVLAPYLGGGFGAGLRAWPHVVLTALAARVVGRPVKLVLTRPQMFTCVGHRPETLQRVRLGATPRRRAGRRSITSTVTTGAMEDEDFEPVSPVTGGRVRLPERRHPRPPARAEHPQPRVRCAAPADAQGNFALESALDELPTRSASTRWSCGCATTPRSTRGSGLPWSSKALRECYRVGAERFGWSRRDPRARLDARRPLAGRLRHGRRQLPVVAGPLPGRGDDRAATAPRSCAAPRPTSAPAPTRHAAARRPSCSGSTSTGSASSSATRTCRGAPAGGSGLTDALGDAVHDACASWCGRSWISSPTTRRRRCASASRTPTVLARRGRLTDVTTAPTS